VERSEVDITTLALSLSDPGTARVHRVGLFGLWASLRALEENGAIHSMKNVHWQLHANGLHLTFSSRWRDGIDELVSHAFGVTSDGFVRIAALGDPGSNPARAVILQDALLATFLQHGKSRGADSRTRLTGSATVEMDGVQHPIRYRRVRWFKHQKPPWLEDGQLEVVNWLLPGAAERHTALAGRTRLREPLERALCLLFLPAGVFYYRIEPVGEGSTRLEAALVLPDPVAGSLEQLYLLRRHYLRLGADRLVVAGPAEAALSLAAVAQVVHALSAFSEAEVWAFGRTQWAPQQRYRARVDVHALRPGAVRLFRLARVFFGAPRLRVQRAGRSDVLSWRVAQSPEWIAGNLLRGFPWWRGFSDLLAPRPRRDAVLRYERGGVARMVDDKELLPDGPERRLVEAIQEAWRRRLGALGELARERGTDFSRLAEREFERWRVTFARCRNEAGIRGAVAELLARAASAAGSLPQLQEGGLAQILELCRDWRKARDLALLALASYQGRDREEVSQKPEVGI
jgi:CRISPR-associated protein Cas8a1/Csx13